MRRFGTALLFILATCSRVESPPVTIGSPAIDPVGEDRTVVYFFKADEAETGSPHSYEAVPTRVEDSEGVEQRISGTLNRLVRGTSAAQSDAGLFSAFDDYQASIRGVVVDAGAVMVDFAGIEDLLIDSSSPPGSALLLAPIYLTIFQFPEVQTVELQFKGSCAALHGRLGGSCEVVTRADHEDWIEAWS